MTEDVHCAYTKQPRQMTAGGDMPRRTGHGSSLITAPT